MSRLPRHLVAAIERHQPRPGESAATAYYTAWLDALEALLAEQGLEENLRAGRCPRGRGFRGRPASRHTER